MIQIQNLSFSYRHTPVFSNINLSFEKGSIYGLLGENGVGKTTLLKIISGLQRPQQGSCTVDGYTSFDRMPAFLQNIVFLPDDVVLPDEATPEKYIKGLAPFYPDYSGEAFSEMMREMDTDPARRFKEMSFGQRKKSLIACALALGTDYVLLDEPTNGLDIPSKASFRRILSKRVGDESTIVIATHQLRDVENLIDPIIILTQDAVLLNAPIRDITEKLLFEYGRQKAENALYSEMMPDGYLNVTFNTTGEESEVNIEALFNAVLRKKEKINQLFNQQ